MSATESRLSDLTKRLSGVEAETASARQVADISQHRQWAYITQLSTGLDYALARPSLGADAAIPRLLNRDLLATSQREAVITVQETAQIKEIVDSLYSPLQQELDRANANLASLRSQADAASKAQQTAEGQVAQLDKKTSTLTSQQLLLSSQLSSQTQAAIKADNAKDAALATWKSIKSWLIGITLFLIVIIVLSHLHLSSVVKTLVK